MCARCARSSRKSLPRVVALALVKQPETRYQDGNLFAADLYALIHITAGTTASTETSAERPIPAVPLRAWPMPYDATLPMDHKDAVAAVAVGHRNTAPSRTGSAETDKAL